MSKLGDKWEIPCEGMFFIKFKNDLYTLEVSTNFGIIQFRILQNVRKYKLKEIVRFTSQNP